MCLREHVFNLFAGPDIPIRHVMLSHILLKVRPLLTFPFCNRSFTDTFHDRKGFLTVHPIINEIRHNIITRTDCGRQCTVTSCNVILRSIKPHIRTMWQTGNTHKVREVFRFRITKHLHNKFRTKLRHTKASQIQSHQIIRRNTKCRCIVKQRQHLLIIERNI